MGLHPRLHRFLKDRLERWLTRRAAHMPIHDHKFSTAVENRRPEASSAPDGEASRCLRSVALNSEIRE
jgi:hypothetical protein